MSKIQEEFEHILDQYEKVQKDVKESEDNEVEFEMEEPILDNFVGVPLDNIIFMKHYFIAEGFDPESDDFIVDILKQKKGIVAPIPIPLPTISYNTYPDLTLTDSGYTYTCTYEEN